MPDSAPTESSNDDRGQFVAGLHEYGLLDWPRDHLFWAPDGKFGAIWFTPSQAKSLRRWWSAAGAIKRFDVWAVFPHSEALLRYVLQESRLADGGRDNHPRDAIIAPVRLITISPTLAAALTAASDPDGVVRSHIEKRRQRAVGIRIGPAPTPKHDTPPDWIEKKLKPTQAALVTFLWGKEEVGMDVVWEHFEGRRPLRRETLASRWKRANSELVEVANQVGLLYQISSRRGEVLILQKAG